MKIEVNRDTTSISVWTISEAPALDPITLFFQGLGKSQGRLIVECYGRAWSAFWSAMGEKTIVEFVRGLDASYLAGCLAPTGTKPTVKDQAYLLRVCKAVVEAVRGGGAA